MKTHLLLFLLLGIGSFAYAQTPEAATILIKNYIAENSKELGLEDPNPEFVITDFYHTRGSDILHVYLAQSIDGIPVKNATATVAIANGEVRHFIGDFIPDLSKWQIATSNPALSKAEVVAVAALSENLTLNGLIPAETSNNKDLFLAPEISLSPIQIDLVYWKTADELKLCYDFALDLPVNHHYYNYKIDAATGEIVAKIDYTQSCFSHQEMGAAFAKKSTAKGASAMLMPPPPVESAYNVFSLPVESPNHGAASLLLSPELLEASPYGWHDTNGDDAAEYTITRGNNVYAYQDEDNDDEPGYSPDGGSGLFFDFPFYTDGTNNLDASVTNLFYINNRIHDIMYVYGFDEPAGNFQFNNYGNGGNEGDHVMAESRDGGGTNNANFATPPDGFNPRMQMYLWSSGGTVSLFSVFSPTTLEGSYISSGLAGFGPALPEEGVTGELVLVADNNGEETDGCSTIVNASEVAGKIAVLRRGGCTFVEKVQNAQNAGAVAVVVVNNTSGNPIEMGGSSFSIDIPSLMIRQNDGQEIIAALQNGTAITGSLHNPGEEDFFDSSFDNSIVIHEYGHGISNRLTGGPSSTDCLYNEEQMGEGWSDFFACMLTMDMSVENPVHRPMATYANGEAVDGNGIRPVPYDTSFAVNSYTYASIGNSSLSVPHGIGFVWCTMLWDLNWALIEEYGYDSDIVNGTGGNNMALQLVTTGLKLQPCNPGFVTARDAILAADELHYDGANQCLIWEVFAKRGLGYGASQGSPHNLYDQQASFETAPGCTEPAAPIAGYILEQTSSCTGLFNFTDNSLNFPESWQWDFGDGNTSTQSNPSHQYEQPGIYEVTLLVENEMGQNEITFQIEYYNVSFTYEVLGSSVAFTNTSTTDVPMKWFFGDGSTTTEENPVHEYQENGEYSVTLLVSGTQGQCKYNEDILVNSVGVDDLENKAFTVAPNPATERVLLSFSSPASKATVLEVFAPDGKLVLSTAVPAGAAEFEVDIKSLAPAAYQFLIRTDKSILNQETIIVQ